MTQYGQIITGDDVILAVRGAVSTWSPSYLAEVAAQKGLQRGVLPTFKSYQKSGQGFRHWPENQIPACLIATPGIRSGSIEKKSNQYSAEWLVAVGMLCSGKDQDTTMRNIQLYVAAVRALFGQHGSLDGFAVETRWIDEDYDQLTFDDSRTIAGGVVNIGVRVDAVLDSAAGLAVPPQDPIADPGDGPTVVTTGITFTQEIDT